MWSHTCVQQDQAATAAKGCHLVVGEAGALSGTMTGMQRLLRGGIAADCIDSLRGEDPSCRRTQNSARTLVLRMRLARPSCVC
jgi:hypothetical protein